MNYLDILAVLFPFKDLNDYSLKSLRKRKIDLCFEVVKKVLFLSSHFSREFHN